MSSFLNAIPMEEVTLTPPYLDNLRPRPTGGTIITFSEADVDRQRRTLEASLNQLAGRTSTYIQHFDWKTAEAGQIFTSKEPVLLSDFGIAVVPRRVISASAATDALTALPEIELARPEFYMFAIDDASLFDDNASTWGIKATRAVDTPFSGRGIKIAILDTGFAQNHPDFRGRNITARSFIDTLGTNDVVGHGTHCAGTAAGPRHGNNVPRYGVAPDVDIFVGKVLDDSGTGLEGDIIAGMVWAIESGCEVISMSLGRAVQPGELPAPEYERIGRRALDRGCLIVAAAGNNSTRQFGYIAPVGAPANARSIMAVAALDPSLDVAPFSSGGINLGGGEVDTCAPGVAVFSAAPLPQAYRTLSGTSMACPHVAGIAALYAESSSALRGQALWDAVIANTAAIPLPTRDVGAGLVQAPAGLGSPADVAVATAAAE